MKLSPEEEKQFVPDSDMPTSRTHLVSQFLRVSEEHVAASGAFVGDFENDGWGWLILAGSASTWSDSPGDDWWFVDPATGERTDRTLSDVEAEMQWPDISVVLGLLFSVPWLWYFLRARIREISDAVRTHSRE